jgi:mono/diheme cytochrome c family protein
MRKFLVLFFIFLFYVSSLPGQDWVVPENRKGRLSPFPFNETTRTDGEKYYTANCMSCHGTPGKGNVINLVPPPPDPATEKVQKNSDGEIYYKVSEGRQQMPSFKNILTSNEIWNVISYIRSFNKSYKQEVMPVITSAAYPGAEIRIRIAYQPRDSTIVLSALAVNANKSVPVTGTAVKLFVHRTFGLLPVDEEKITDNNGIAAFRIPDNLPGDKDGNIRVSARFTNEELFGAISKDTVISAGEKTIPVSLVAKRAMWNKAKMAPIWIILTFIVGLMAVWGFIFYILLLLRDVYVIGESLEKKNTESQE